MDYRDRHVVVTGGTGALGVKRITKVSIPAFPGASQPSACCSS